MYFIKKNIFELIYANEIIIPYIYVQSKNMNISVTIYTIFYRIC